MLGRLDYPNPSLIDDVVELRKWDYGDIDCIEAASSDPRIPAGTTVPTAFTAAEGRAFIERQWDRRDSGEGISLAIAEAVSGQATGLIVMLHRQDPSVVGLGYWIVPECRSRGLASRAVRLAAAWALQQPAVAEIEAIVEPDNTASLRILHLAEFRRAGEAEVDGRQALRLTRKP